MIAFYMNYTVYAAFEFSQKKVFWRNTLKNSVPMMP